MELEGLRAVAALIVVLFHSIVIFYPAMFYGLGHNFAPIAHGTFEAWVFGTPLNAFVSGAFAVSIFFVLSGFVLSIGFFQTKREDIIKKLAIKRYLRLMLPALGSVLLVYILLVFHLDQGKVLAESISQSGASSSLWKFDPSFIGAVAQGTWQIFALPLGDAHYNPVLWTIQYELLGSFLVFGALLLFGALKLRWWAYIGLAVFFFNTWFLGFVIGMVIADLYANRQSIFTTMHSKKGMGIGGSLVICGLFLGGYPLVDPSSGIYHMLYVSSVPLGANLINYTTFGATLILLAILMSPQISRVLRYRWVSGLGRYTYSLYLVHLPVLLTVGASAFVLFHSVMGYKWAVFATIITVAPVMVVASWLFEKYIDAPSIKAADLFYRLTEGKRMRLRPTRRGVMLVALNEDEVSS